MTMDLRALLDPLLAVKAARPEVREIQTPDGVEQQIAVVDPSQLPSVALTSNPGGGTAVDLGAQVALLQSALGRLADMQLRGVHGAVTLTSTITIGVGQTRDIPLTWETAPLAPCRHAVARLDVGVAWLGRVTAAIVPSSVTDDGATVRLTAVSFVAISVGQPLTVHADGTYLYWPPFEGP